MKQGDPVIGVPIGPMSEDHPTVTGTYHEKNVKFMNSEWVKKGIYVPSMDYVVECESIEAIHPRRNRG